MKITAVHVDTLELTMEEPFVIASSAAAGITVMMGNMGESSVAMSAHLHVNIALANAVHGDADLTWRPGDLEHGIGRGIKQEVETASHGSTCRPGRVSASSSSRYVELQRVERRS